MLSLSVTLTKTVLHRAYLITVSIDGFFVIDIQCLGERSTMQVKNGSIIHSNGLMEH